MKEAAMFDHYMTEPKKGQNKQCQLCNRKFGVISPQQHICKRCFRSVCDDCKTEKVQVWKDNFNQSAHKMCKNCKMQSDAIKSTIRVDRLMFASESETAMKWKKSITYQSKQQYKSDQNNVLFSESLLLQLWNSLTYSMKDFIGNILGQKPQSKISVILNYMNEVLNKINKQTEIRVQTAAYLSLFLLCYCSPSTAVDIGVYLIKELRNCSAQKIMLNQLLKDSNCSQTQIKNMQDYIDKKYRKFTSILVQNLLQDMIQTPTSVILLYASMLATLKKIILNQDNNNKNVDFILLQQGDPIAIKKNYSQLKSRFLKKFQRKNSKKLRQQQINNQQIQNPRKIGQTVNNLVRNKQINSIVSQQFIIQKTQSFHFQNFNKQETQQILNQQKQQKSLSDIEAGFNNYYNQQKRFKKQKLKMPKIGSYMDLSKDFQMYLRSIKSLGLQRVVSSQGIKQVHRIQQDYEFTNYWQQQDQIKDKYYNKLREQYYSSLQRQIIKSQESFQINSYARKYYQSLFPFQTLQQSISSETQTFIQPKILYVYSSIVDNKEYLNYFNVQTLKIETKPDYITPIKQNSTIPTQYPAFELNLIETIESKSNSQLMNNIKVSVQQIQQKQQIISPLKHSIKQDNLIKSECKTSHLVNWCSKPITNSQSKQLSQLGQTGRVGEITNQIQEFISKKYSLQQINKNDTQIIKKVKTQLKDTLQKQKYLEMEANQLRNKVRYYEKVLPQKQKIIMEYKNKQKQDNIDNSQNSFLNNSKIQSDDLSKSEIRRLQQRIKLLENQNKKLQNQKTKLESQSIFNNSSIKHTDNFNENSNDLSMLSSRSVLKFSQPTPQVVELKKQLQLMAFTLKQKNNFLDTLAIQNKKLLLEYEVQKNKQSSKIIMCKQQYEDRIIKLQKEKDKFKSQNERLMDRLQEMTMKLLNIEEQLIEQNRKHFDYQ